MDRKIAFFLFLLPSLIFGAANDLTISQRNPTDTGSLTRVLSNPTGYGIVIFNPNTVLPDFLTLDGTLKVTSGSLAVDASQFATAAQGALASSSLQSFAVGTVTGLSAGSSPTITNSGTGTAVVLNFGIPAGAQGIQGIQGPQGLQGSAGTNGTNGSNGSAATITIGTVTGLSAGATPTVTNSGNSGAAVFNFGLPAGATGSQGIQGLQGNTGTAGATGAAGASGVVSVTAPITNSGTSSAANIGISAATTSAAGSLSASDKTKLDSLSVPSARVFSTPTFTSSTTATQLSATRDAFVSYSYDATVNISLIAGQSVTATLKYADNIGMTTNVVTLPPQKTSNSGVLGLTQGQTLTLTYVIPAGKFRQVTFAVTGGATAPTTMANGQTSGGQEVLLP